MSLFQKLSPALQKALAAMKYSQPTPMQEQAIPPALINRDLIVCAPSGTGKSAAICIPIIAKLERNPKKSALILVPSREVANQIISTLKELTPGLPDIKHVLLMDGAAMPPQAKALEKDPRIIVATPGRLMEHLKRGALSLSRTDILVLDEADRMLDLGFAPQLNEVLRFLPRVRQTLLFSATLPNDIVKLATKYLKDPVRVTVEAQEAPPAKKVNSRAKPDLGLTIALPRSMAAASAARIC